MYVCGCVRDCVLLQVGMLNSSTTHICVNIYIYREREGEREIYRVHHDYIQQYLKANY